MPDKIKYICIEGNIGAGKTTLAKILAQKLSAHLVLEEFEENPYLPLFYNDKDKYSFQLEMSFLLSRYKQLQHLYVNNVFQQRTISDYFIIKCLLFSKNNLNDFDFTLFQKLFDVIYQTSPQPQLLIFIKSPITKLLENIKNRNRDFEQNISKDYLADINEKYLSFIKTTKIPKLIIENENIDFLNDNLFIEKLVERIEHGIFEDLEIFNY